MKIMMTILAISAALFANGYPKYDAKQAYKIGQGLAGVVSMMNNLTTEQKHRQCEKMAKDSTSFGVKEKVTYLEYTIQGCVDKVNN